MNNTLTPKIDETWSDIDVIQPAISLFNICPEKIVGGMPSRFVLEETRQLK